MFQQSFDSGIIICKFIVRVILQDKHAAGFYKPLPILRANIVLYHYLFAWMQVHKHPVRTVQENKELVP